MALLDKAAEYILGILAKNEAVRKFPQDFVTASAEWIRSWFLKDDPVTSVILEDQQQAAPVKQAVLAAKLKSLEGNEQFQQELAQHLQTYHTLINRSKNIIGDGAEVKAGGNITIGDTGTHNDQSYDSKNKIMGNAKVQAGGNIRLGDDTYSGNQQVNITHNYYPGTPQQQQPSSSNAPQHQNSGASKPVPASIASAVREFIGKAQTERAITELKTYAAAEDPELLTIVLHLSAQFQENNKKERLNVISNSEAGVERSKVTLALLNLL